MNTLSISRYVPLNGHSSLSDLFSNSSSKRMTRRLNKMTGGRLPMLKTSSVRSRSDMLPWVAGAGAIALAGAGIAYAMKKLGSMGLLTRSMSDESGQSGQSHYSVRNHYPTAHATAGGMAPEMHSSGQ